MLHDLDICYIIEIVFSLERKLRQACNDEYNC